MAAVGEGIGESAVYSRSYQDKTYRQGFVGTVGDLQKAGVLQDVVLEVEGRRFPCHRLVLSAASPYFRAMFTSGMAESRQNTVLLQGLDPDMIEEILSYMYSGTLHVSMDTVQPLYQAADLLQLDYVRETCSSYMAMNVEHSTCLNLYKFADIFSMGTVKDRCLQCICRYFVKVSTTAEFCSLSVDQLTDIISQDWLDVKEETTVWEAVVRWVEHSREDRHHHLPSILPHIRFNLLTSEHMAAILEHPLVREDPGSLRVIGNAVHRGASNVRKRFGMDTQEMVLLFSNSTKEMLFMNPRIETYIKCPVKENLDGSKVVAMTVTSTGDIYILAKEQCNELSLLVYNHFSNVWEHQSSVYRSDRDRVTKFQKEFIVEVDGHLFYLAESDLRPRVRRYNKHTDQWLECSQPQLNGESVSEMAVSCGGHLYYMTDVEMHRYHPSEDQWCKLAVQVNSPDTNSAVATQTEIFCDNQHFLGLTCVYDTKTDSWQELPPDLEEPQEAPYDHMNLNDTMYFVLEGQLHLYLRYDDVDYTRSAWRICVRDRANGVWRDLQATLPSGDWWMPFPVCYKAHMYLACLNANSTDVTTTATST